MGARPNATAGETGLRSSWKAGEAQPLRGASGAPSPQRKFGTRCTGPTGNLASRRKVGPAYWISHWICLGNARWRPSSCLEASSRRFRIPRSRRRPRGSEVSEVPKSQRIRRRRISGSFGVAGVLGSRWFRALASFGSPGRFWGFGSFWNYGVQNIRSSGRPWLSSVSGVRSFQSSRGAGGSDVFAFRKFRKFRSFGVSARRSFWRFGVAEVSVRGEGGVDPEFRSPDWPSW